MQAAEKQQELLTLTFQVIRRKIATLANKWRVKDIDLNPRKYTRKDLPPLSRKLLLFATCSMEQDVPPDATRNGGSLIPIEIERTQTSQRPSATPR